MMLESRDNRPLAEETEDIYTVTELSDAIRQSLESEFPRVTVIGEITNFTAHSSGHFYLTLRDGSSRLGAVIFSRYTRNVDFAPEDGMTAVASGRISHYGGGGRTQLIADSMRLAGEGDLELNKRRLLAKLMEEGLTDPSRKRDLPPFPERIAVVTSPEGAAVEDIRRTICRRWPLAEMRLVPAAVQGEAAAGSIVEAFAKLDEMDGIDAVILARGGGSAGDLWSFNDEAVARAVAGCRYPVVTGIGHEIDTSVCDYVADLSAATPTAAAEMTTPDAREVRGAVEALTGRIADLSSSQSRKRLERVEFMMRSSAFPAIEHRLERSRLELDDRTARLTDWRKELSRDGIDEIRNLSVRLQETLAGTLRESVGLLRDLSERFAGLNPSGGVGAGRERLERLMNSARLMTEGNAAGSRGDLRGKMRTLRGLGPGEVLGRGYTYCMSEDGRSIIGSIEDVEEGGRISVTFFDGDAGCLVESMRKDGRWRQRLRSKTR
jgi:exodeoxyribonuclease VII large subunit